MLDISDAFALSRPAGRPVFEKYLRRRSGKESIPQIHPTLDKILKSTYGLLIYQEQILDIARDVAGFNPEQAELLRKSISKERDPDRLNTLRQSFITGCERHGLNHLRADQLFDRFLEFTEYGFLKAHALSQMQSISYVAAYLLCHHPQEYLTEVMKSQTSYYYKENQPQIYQQELNRRLGHTQR